MSWPWRRTAPSPPEPPEPPAAAPATAPAPPAWRSLPPVQRLVEPIALTAPVARLQSSLSSWSDPRFLAPLGHLVDPDGPSGHVAGLTRAAPVHDPTATPAELPLPPGRPRPHRDAVVQRARAAGAAPTPRPVPTVDGLDHPEVGAPVAGGFASPPSGVPSQPVVARATLPTATLTTATPVDHSLPQRPTTADPLPRRHPTAPGGTDPDASTQDRLLIGEAPGEPDVTPGSDPPALPGVTVQRVPGASSPAAAMPGAPAATARRSPSGGSPTHRPAAAPTDPAPSAVQRSTTAPGGGTVRPAATAATAATAAATTATAATAAAGAAPSLAGPATTVPVSAAPGPSARAPEGRRVRIGSPLDVQRLAGAGAPEAAGAVPSITWPPPESPAGGGAGIAPPVGAGSAPRHADHDDDPVARPHDGGPVVVLRVPDSDTAPGAPHALRSLPLAVAHDLGAVPDGDTEVRPTVGTEHAPPRDEPVPHDRARSQPGGSPSSLQRQTDEAVEPSEVRHPSAAPVRPAAGVRPPDPAPAAAPLGVAPGHAAAPTRVAHLLGETAELPRAVAPQVGLVAQRSGYPGAAPRAREVPPAAPVPVPVPGPGPGPRAWVPGTPAPAVAGPGRGTASGGTALPAVDTPVQRAADPGAAALAAGIAHRDGDGSIVFLPPTGRPGGSTGAVGPPGHVGHPSAPRSPLPTSRYGGAPGGAGADMAVQRRDVVVDAPAATAPPIAASPAGAPPVVQGATALPAPSGPATTDPAPAAASEVAPATATSSPMDVDELVRRLYDPLSARLRAELRLDRERAGALTDLRH